MAAGPSVKDKAGAAALQDADRALMQAHGRKLIRVAVSAVIAGLRTGNPPKILMKSVPEPLQVPRATFVTLTKDGKLRGCIGSLSPQRPLVLDVAYNAYSAAFRDPRFQPLDPKEAKNLGVSIALLSAPEALPVASEAELLSKLEPGKTGLIISDAGPGGGRAVFLPQVWDDIPEPRTFLTRLKMKAGMKPDHWSDGFTAQVFTVQKTPPLGYEDQGDKAPVDSVPAVASAQ